MSYNLMSPQYGTVNLYEKFSKLHGTYYSEVSNVVLYTLGGTLNKSCTVKIIDHTCLFHSLIRHLKCQSVL